MAPNLAATLLCELVRLPEVCLVVGPDAAVCEAFVEPAALAVRLEGTWVTLESTPWHLHFDTAQVRRIAFEVKPDTAHHSERLSYSVRFFDADGQALLRAFFLNMYDDRGALRPERVQQFEALRARAGQRDEVWCSPDPL
ncbi:MAG: hypothetical protein KatS3mg131_0751 [Candidatus Tectimicrobiota bacterium]|nr:MAG: hypothetical protein KatS3mg131_0751 [Candidatus Tectomicrobia bacterium]